MRRDGGGERSEERRARIEEQGKEKRETKSCKAHKTSRAAKRTHKDEQSCKAHAQRERKKREPGLHGASRER